MKENVFVFACIHIYVCVKKRRRERGERVSVLETDCLSVCVNAIVCVCEYVREKGR